MAANVIQLDHLLRRYGREADGVRDLLRRYTAMKLQDLFPESSATKPTLDNPRTVSLLERAPGPAVSAGSPQRTPALAAIGGSATKHRCVGLAVAFDRAGRARNPGSAVVCGLVLAVPAFHEFRPVRTR